ncbi:MAG: histidine phosphatase family protein [Acidimicrobiales bacterium]|nr:histidine phosphatase family protein [Acidimicrobiales bacterium]
MNDGPPRVWLVRHGETAWSRDGRHTSRTDVELTPRGKQQARALAPVMDPLDLDLVVCSPRRRAQQTAELAGLIPYEVADDLREWDYGALEGLTTPEIQVTWPGWTIWDGPWPDGETAADVGGRADRFLAGVLGSGASRVALVGHGHFSRVIGARWVGSPAAGGRGLDLDTATWSELGWSRKDRVIRRWNVPSSSAATPTATPGAP